MNVHVDFVAGVPVIAKHTGALFHMVGPGGAVFLVAGELAFEYHADANRPARQLVRFRTRA